jgi:Domain of unknown function (DUF4124)
MNKPVLLAIVVLIIGAYVYRDRWLPMSATKESAQAIYKWKDKDGKVHYSTDKSSAPADAKSADLPGISILESDQEELAKQAERLREKDKPTPSGDVEKPKLPEMRNLAIERIEKAAEGVKK